jgi:radical SAM protein with 4Fe4S-binding SPASM domain
MTYKHGSHLSGLVWRSVGDDFLYLRKKFESQSLAFDGPLVEHVVHFLNTGNWRDKRLVTESYNEEDAQAIVGDYESVKAETEAFLGQHPRSRDSEQDHDGEFGAERSQGAHQAYIEAATRLKQLISCDVEVTNQCNLRCGYCYHKSYASSGLSAEEHDRIAAGLFNLGCLYVSLTGGELLLRKDIVDLASHYIRAGLLVELKSNASIRANDAIRRLVDAGVRDYQITVHDTVNGHSEITRTQYDYVTVIENINLLLGLGITPSICLMAHMGNYDRIEEIYQRIIADTGVKPSINPFITNAWGKNGIEGMTLTAEKLLDVCSRYLGDDSSDPLRTPFAKRSNVCGAGLTQIAITSNGDVLPCLEFPLRMGNVLDEPLSRIMLRRESVGNQTKTENFKICSDCEKRDQCDSCPGLAYGRNHATTIPHPVKCLFTKTLSCARG